jgi:hypothetical protein
MATYAIEMDDGSVAIMQTLDRPALDDEGLPVLRAATAEECLAQWHPDLRARVIRHRPVEPDALPVDRTFRDAWTLTDAGVVHDMAKARAIKRDMLRAERTPLLAALDVEYQRADERKDDAAKATIAAKKQALRDVTSDPAIDAAATVEELKALKPDVLDATTVVSPVKG